MGTLVRWCVRVKLGLTIVGQIFFWCIKYVCLLKCNEVSEEMRFALALQLIQMSLHLRLFYQLIVILQLEYT